MAFDYFPDGIMKDICEQNNACDVDQHSFKAYLSRWMAAATQMAPFTYETTAPLLLSSAKAAVAQCTGQPNGTACGLKWYLNGTWDGTTGVGQQMAALEVVLGTMVGHATAAVTNSTGGTSASNPTAGYNASNVPPGDQITPPTKADRAGAWFLTGLFSLFALYMWWFMNTDSHEGSRSTIGGKPGRKGRTMSTIGIGTESAAGVVMAGANGKPANVLTKQDHRASTGVFPSDRNGHVRSGSYGSEKGVGVGLGGAGMGGNKHTSLRSLPPIVESKRNSVNRRSAPIYRGD
jgi:mannan endo-1,6-alpha-mannosidase